MSHCTALDGTTLHDDYIRELVLNAEFKVAHFIVSKYITKRQLSGHHIKIINHGAGEGKSLQLTPRGHGKSTIGTVDYSITKLLRDGNIRILICSKTQTQAEAFLKEIRSHFEINEDLIRIFGDLKGDKWSDKEFNLSTRTIIKKEANMSALGASGQVVSKHYDIIINDDLVSFENARTQGQRAKLQEWVYSSLEPTLEPGGIMKVIGTRYHPNDLYQHFIDLGSYNVCIQKALNTYTEEEFGDWKQRGLLPADIKEGDEFPLWDYFGMENLLERKRASGSIIFGMQFQNTTELAKGNIIKYEYLRYYDSWEFRKDGRVDVHYKDEHTGESITKTCRLFMGVDLAISQKETADFFVICVIGKSDDNKYFVLDIFKDRLSFDGQINKILEYGQKKFDAVERIGVEAVAYQQAMCQELRRQSNLPVVNIRTTKDKVTRLMRRSALFENGQIYLRPNQQDLIDQLLLMPESSHDDMFDSLDFAIQVAEEKTKARVIKGLYT